MPEGGTAPQGRECGALIELVLGIDWGVDTPDIGFHIFVAQPQLFASLDTFLACFCHQPVRRHGSSGQNDKKQIVKFDSHGNNALCVVLHCTAYVEQ